MSESLEQLFHTTTVKEFVRLFKEAEKKYEKPEAFLAEAAGYLPVRLYDRYYTDRVPHSFYGLAAAHRVQASLSAEACWRPLAQQCWFATQERKRTPLDLSGGEKPEGSAEARWDLFQQAARSGNFGAAMAAAGSFLDNDQERNQFRRKSLMLALEDGAHGGLKFLYLFLTWGLAEGLQWKETRKILAPALHFLVLGPADLSLCQVTRELRQHGTLRSVAAGQGELTEQAYRPLEKTLLFTPEAGPCLREFEKLAQGMSLQALQDGLLLAAAQAVVNSDRGAWIWPMRAFHLIYCLQQCSELPPEQAVDGVLLAAALLNQASTRSRGVDENRKLDEVARRLSPVDPINTLKSLISHSDPHASATAVYAILGMDGKVEELFQVLLGQAMKNDGHVCYGNDLLYAHESAQTYQRLKVEERRTLPVSVGYFLGQIKKSYELAGAYGV